MRDFTHHLKHYLPLLGIIATCLIGFVVFSYDKAFQMAIFIACSLSYVAWGFIHHHIHRDLEISVVIEYLTIAILGIVIVFSLLFRA